MCFYYVYVLFSHKDHKLYTGYSTNLKQRIHDHYHGKVRATKDRLPLELIHYEAYRNDHDARARERFLKSGFGRGQLKKSLQNDLSMLGYEFFH